MDQADRTILAEACNDCRISYESLAKKVNLSPNAVKNRVQNLIDNGVLYQFYVVLAADVFDADFFQATIKTDGSEKILDFVTKLGTDSRIAHISLLASVGGGAYLLWGQYIGNEDLQDLGQSLRRIKEVVDVEIYTLINIRDQKYQKMDLTKLHLKVLSCLVENPRMSIAEVSDCSGYSPKSVRRALRELKDSRNVWFLARPDLAAGGLVNIHVEIIWDEKDTNSQEIGKWLRETYPVSLWDIWITAHHPLLYAEFAVDDLQEALSIVLNIRNTLKIKSTSTLVSYSSAKFPYHGELKLKELLQNSQFQESK